MLYVCDAGWLEGASIRVPSGTRASLLVQLVNTTGANISSAAGQDDSGLVAGCSSYEVPGPSLPAATADGQSGMFAGLLADQGSWCGAGPQVRPGLPGDLCCPLPASCRECNTVHDLSCSSIRLPLRITCALRTNVPSTWHPALWQQSLVAISAIDHAVCRGASFRAAWSSLHNKPAWKSKLQGISRGGRCDG